MTRGLLTVVLAVLALPVLVIAAAAGTFGVSDTGSAPTAEAVEDIPADYLHLYQAAGDRYRVPWEVLAAVGKVECDHGRLDHLACRQQGAENFAGAGGPMQFLAATWAAYGVDADDDGHADRWNPGDAIFGTARYLRASGAPGDLRAALFAYNHSDAYVDDVLAWADRYRRQAAASPAAILGADAAELQAAVLASDRIELWPEGALDVRAGHVDPRLLGALLALSQDFQLAGVGPFRTGHAYNVAGTSRPSNHAFGRAVDIGTINGVLVSYANKAARAAAVAAASLPGPLRPSEIGSPFGDIPGGFTDKAHQDHLHLGYDQ